MFFVEELNLHAQAAAVNKAYHDFTLSQVLVPEKGQVVLAATKVITELERYIELLEKGD